METASPLAAEKSQRARLLGKVACVIIISQFGVLITCLCLNLQEFRVPINLSQLVQRPTERPRAMLTRVRVPGAARNFVPTVSFRLDRL